MKHIALTLLATTFLSATAFGGMEVDEISHDALKSAIEAGTVTLIDVNGSESFAEGHLPGAIDFEASKDQLAAKLPEDKGALIVAYCGGPGCGAHKRGTKAATELGYTNVKHYKGGLSGWKEAGEKLAMAN